MVWILTAFPDILHLGIPFFSIINRIALNIFLKNYIHHFICSFSLKTWNICRFRDNVLLAPRGSGLLDTEWALRTLWEDAGRNRLLQQTGTCMKYLRTCTL